MNPLSLSIVPEPEAHSGQPRLQLFVSSSDTVAGMPYVTGSPVRELTTYEYADFTAFAGLTIIPAMC